MGNNLFGDIVFGPVKSRRLGLSLGVNILPVRSKICSFNCLYCECGWNTPINKNSSFVSVEIVKEALFERLQSAKESKEKIDVITFAGNGEPTINPSFPKIIDVTIELRNKFLPGIPIAVLSNSTMLSNEEIRNTLLKIELPILKLDSAFPETIKVLNNVSEKFNFDDYFSGLLLMKEKAIIQIMLIKGIHNNIVIDNTSEKEINKLIKILKEIKPLEIQLYTLHRTPPASQLEKINDSKLKEIEAIFINEGFKTHLVLN